MWPEYVPVSERRAKADRALAKLRKANREIHPVEIDGRTIARSFWGKGWCRHLESFGDYSNRLPRGRTYVRQGAVCHLGIERGRVEALVSGSRMYEVRVDITPLQPAKWNALKKRCTGRIGSLIELLQGALSDEIMRAVTDRADGLFPLPGEIRYTCSCPDWAAMCKHISAVMYGIGARLDAHPDLLFMLRGVNHEELISAEASTEILAGNRSRRRRTLKTSQLESVFGVELDDSTPEPPPTPPPAPAPKRKPSPAKKSKRTKRSAPAAVSTPFRPTGPAIADLRKRLGMTRSAFADDVGVSPATITNWESAAARVKPHAKNLAALTRLHRQASPSR